MNYKTCFKEEKRTLLPGLLASATTSLTTGRTYNRKRSKMMHIRQSTNSMDKYTSRIWIKKIRSVSRLGKQWRVPG
jgi:hypothetical protein